MDETAAEAVGALSLFFSTAANLYKTYARRVDLGGGTQTIEALADERTRDSGRLAEAASTELAAPSTPSSQVFDPRSELSFGRTFPRTPSQVMYRVQRAEKQLGDLTDHLISVVRPGRMREVLEGTLQGINSRQPQLRALKRAAANSAQTHDYLAHRSAAGALDYFTIDAAGPPGVEGQELTVWFCTNRERAGRGWSRRAGNSVHFGFCRVFVPKDRPIGSLGPTLTRWGTKAVRVNETVVLAEDAFWAELRVSGAQLAVGARHALVFLHGYHTSFEKAARRTAQLKADLQHLGPAAFFSWPSADQALGYASDKAAIEGSEVTIRDFLVDFVQRAGVDKVHIIAHSMGNIGLLRAMDAIARDAASRTGVKFGQVVLAAPDVDSRLFESLAQAYSQLSARTTLYVAENDKALGKSRWLHGQYARAGLAPPVVVVPGVDTVNVSQINLDLLGHSYAVGLDKVLADIHALLRDGASPDQRFRLRPVGAHWEFKP